MKTTNSPNSCLDRFQFYLVITLKDLSSLGTSTPKRTFFLDNQIINEYENKKQQLVSKVLKPFQYENEIKKITIEIKL